ncbi:tetratricopeptide repeat protein [Nonomuraea salmonea]|uniref:Tetratricopeptide repeat protein n=2 Tax=Nonomuraea salmonea TaxID=46181 RepID=A0ABV5NHI9_9ACTN
MSGWLRWSRDSAPGLLAAYVQRGVVGKMLGDDRPAPGAGARLDRARVLYEAFARRDITYAHEDPASDTAGQMIRTPGEVLLYHRHATCLDIAVTYAGGCLDAGLHPLIVIAEPATAGGAFHAFVVVWLGGEYQRPASFDYPLTSLVHQEMPAEVALVQETNGTFLAIDVTGAAHGYGGRADPLPWADAVTAGTELCGRWSFAVDIGLYEGDVLPQPATPTNDPLTFPYYKARTRAGPLAELQARRGRIPFAPREELDLLIDWCEVADPQNRTKITILHGLGGAGKTHLAAELAATMANQGWHTGFLIRKPDDVQLAWLGRLVSPLLVVIDYAEAVKAEDVNALLRAVRGRAAPTRVVLTARLVGDWWTDLEGLLSVDDHDVAVSPRPIEPLHPAPLRVFLLAYRAFTGHDLTVPSPADLPQPAQWTTLDLVLHAWLAAEGVRDLPRGHAHLYEEVMRREFQYWQKTYRERHASDAPPKHTFWSLGACLALLSPRKERIPELVTAVLDIDDRLVRDHLADLIEEMLHTDPEAGTVSIRPDPIGAHLLVRPHPRDPDLLDRCIQAATDTEAAHACLAISRAAQNDTAKARDLASAALGRRRNLWQVAYIVAAAQGGPFVPALEALAREPDTPLPLASLAGQIPIRHSALGGLALIAAKAQVSREAAADEEALARQAWALNTLAVRQSDVGDRSAALATIQQAVAHYRTLTEANQEDFLPDLAGSLQNLSNQQAKAGDREGALESVREAVAIHRALVEADQAAFLPDLAMSLSNLSVHQSATGDQKGALESAREAVTIHRALIGTNHVASLPGLAGSLQNLSNQQAEAGDREGALKSVREAVAIHRALSSTNPAGVLPDLAQSLGNLSLRQAQCGDREGALGSIQEAVVHHRTLAQANPTVFLPDLAMSLHNLALRLAECGNRVAALEPAQEAVAHYRALITANGALYLDMLAAALHTLSVRQSETGDREGALKSIREGVAIRQTLVKADSAAFLPGLAGSLNTFSLQQAECGDRQGALKSSHEAVAHHRTLAEVNPGAFLTDLLMSLNTFADLLEKLERAGKVAGVWSEIASGLRPGAQAECLAHLVARQFADGRRSAAVKTLTRAIQCADADEDPQWRGRARRALQRVGAQLAAEEKKPEKWPYWVVCDLSDEEMERLNRWLTAADWETKAAYLRAEYTALSGEDGRSALDLAQAWYPEFHGLQELSGLLDAIEEGGLDQVIDLLTAHNRRVLLTRAWLNSPDWDQSRAFLRENIEELAHPETVALLKSTEDEIAHQHAAILELLESLELDEVFDAVTDVTVAADHGYRFLEAGAWIKLAPLSRAVPHLMTTPFVSPFLAAVAAVLRGTPEDGSDPEAWMRTAAEAATDTQRRAGVARLRRMTRRFPEHAAALERLIELLEAEPAET